MQWVYTPYVLPLLISAAVSGMLALYIWERRSVSGAKPFGAMMASVGLWSVANILELVAVDLPSKLTWKNIEHIFIVFTPVLWVIFASEYTGKARWLKRRNWILLALLPLITLVMLWTNPYHHLVLSRTQLAIDGPLVFISQDYGPSYWIWVVYAYAMLLLGSVYLIQFFSHGALWYSRQVVTLVAAILLPWLSNMIYIFRLLPLPSYDTTPIFFSISGVIVALTIFRFRLIDVLPIARAIVVENIADGVLIFDQKDCLVDINPAGRKILGLAQRVKAGASYRQVLSRFPDLVSYFPGQQETRLETSIDANEEQLFYEIRISPIFDGFHDLTGKLVVLRDISEHKRSERDLEKSHLLLEATLEATADGILVISAKDRSFRFNRKFLEMWRIPNEVINPASEQNLMAFILDQLVNPAAFYRLMNKLSNQLDAESYDVLELKDGRVFERYSHPQRVGEKRVGRVWSFRDITEQRRAEEKLRYLSSHDILTGLYNRVYFEEEINRLENGRQYPISLIMADVDGLKQINDQYGHQAGDELLRKAAEILRQACRVEDMVARIGGDEFGIVLPFADVAAAESAVQRIRNMMAMAQVGEGKAQISLSLGSATAENGQSLRKMLQLADKAMYQSKNSRNRRRAHAVRVEENQQV
ncbi:MAG TPA: histidine kinase N-terminal 7TM domain-containing protein [Anaerolineaceae bacterium]|nr:histidine kinase N-terminal 7TM domain-containing protein [Anaerolineaceae bacterium]